MKLFVSLRALSFFIDAHWFHLQHSINKTSNGNFLYKHEYNNKYGAATQYNI